MEHDWTVDVFTRMRVACVTQKTLAEEIGISTVYLNEVLNGRRSPRRPKCSEDDHIRDRIYAALEKLEAAREGQNHDG